MFLWIYCIIHRVDCAIDSGASSVNFNTVFQVFGDLFVHNDAITETQRQIVLGIRLPRVLAAILAGIALSNAGLLMQGVFQNPLVSPYTLGVSNGASFGAALAIVFSSHFAFLNLGTYLLPVFAFISSVLTMILVYGIAKIAKNSSKTLILSGVAVGYLFSALVSLLKYVSDAKELPELVFWTMGGFSGINWTAIAIMAGACLLSFIIMMYFSWDLNVMTAGEESAISLGVNYKKIRMIAFDFIYVINGSSSIVYRGHRLCRTDSSPCYSYDSRQRLSLYDSGVFIGRSSFISTV